MKIYHYTKGVSMNSIFTDGFLATERKRGLNKIAKLTDCVWLTEQAQFPKTALPNIPRMPETNLALHLNQIIYVDLDKLSEFTGGVYRFAFNSDDARFTKWRFSQTRKTVENNTECRIMENIANKVGDNARSYWISDSDVHLTNFTLEEFSNGQWRNLLTDCSIDNMSADQENIVGSIKERSVSTCKQYGLPLHHVRNAQ